MFLIGDSWPSDCFFSLTGVCRPNSYRDERRRRRRPFCGDQRWRWTGLVCQQDHREINPLCQACHLTAVAALLSMILPRPLRVSRAAKPRRQPKLSPCPRPPRGSLAFAPYRLVSFSCFLFSWWAWASVDFGNQRRASLLSTSCHSSLNFSQTFRGDVSCVTVFYSRGKYATVRLLYFVLWEM